MKVPFQLRRCDRHPASALLLPEDVEQVLRLCGSLAGTAGSPVIHAVAGGFLLRLAAPSAAAFPGAIHLRALAANLFVPADADLTPALLADEAEALVRQRGLVFLPGGRVLAFAPETRLGAGDLVAVPRLPRRSWAPLPQPPERPEELREVVLEQPDLAASLLLEEAGGDIGSEPVQPAAAGPAQEAAGRARALLGQGLFWLGSKLSWKALAQLGAGMVRKAIEQAPRLSERLLGKQESALRELLRQFREGKVEDALRRAVPLSRTPERGSRPAPDANLPIHGLAYRLADFLTPSRHPSGVWFGGPSIYDELHREYRKAAEDAARRGDFLRAAVIYGKLLEDWPRMAAMLSRAGLHHDAALVYLQLLHDPLQAAGEFEAAGEFDRALEIYAHRGEHIAAGDLLRRLGETERALAEYLRAADREAARGCHTAAARLLVARAGRPDLAEEYLVAGWERRPAAEAVGCLHELQELYVKRGDRARLLQLIEQAEEYFAGPGEDHAAARFSSGLGVLADAGVFPDLSDDLRDRALLIVARKLAQRGRAGDRSGAVVSRLLGGRPWDPALVRDAEVALRALGQPEARRGVERRLRTYTGNVTAACAAWETGDLFLGFEGGAFVQVRPASGEMTVAQTNSGAVVALSCDARGAFVVMLRRAGDGRYWRWSSGSDAACGPFRLQLLPRSAEEAPRLSPVAACGGQKVVAMWDGECLEYWTGPDLAAEMSEESPDGAVAVLLLEQIDPIPALRSAVVFCADGFACLTPAWRAGELVPTRLPWVTTAPPEPGLPWLAWRWLGPTSLEVAAVNTEGQLCWAALRVFTEEAGVQSACRSMVPTRFLAAALLPSGLVAGVHRGGVAWYRPGRDRLRLVAQTQGDLADAATCFASPATGELLVVCRHGDLVRVPTPE